MVFYGLVGFCQACFARILRVSPVKRSRCAAKIDIPRAKLIQAVNF
jgi:hypothetical protein